MKLTSVDSICKSVLLKRSLPLHFYIDVLLAAMSCARELHLDDLKVVNKVVLPIMDGFIEIPDSYIDWVRVAARTEDGLKTLTPTKEFRDIDDNTFIVCLDSNGIEINPNIEATIIELDYISDGRAISAATGVEVYAEATFEAYLSWQLIDNSSSYGMGEKEMMYQRYVSARKILRARKADWSLDTLRKIINKVY
jgi:hypothetical protein